MLASPSLRARLEGHGLGRVARPERAVEEVHASTDACCASHPSPHAEVCIFGKRNFFYAYAIFSFDGWATMDEVRRSYGHSHCGRTRRARPPRRAPHALGERRRLPRVLVGCVRVGLGIELSKSPIVNRGGGGAGSFWLHCTYSLHVQLLGSGVVPRRRETKCDVLM